MNLTVSTSDKLYFKDDWDDYLPFVIPGLKDEITFKITPDTIFVTSIFEELIYDVNAPFRVTDLYEEILYSHPVNMRVTDLYLEVAYDYFSPWIVFEA